MGYDIKFKGFAEYAGTRRDGLASEVALAGERGNKSNGGSRLGGAALLTTKQDAMSHTRSFEKALAVIPETSHSYLANLSPSWAVGDGE